MRLVRVWLALVTFGIAFGYVEAAVVVYLQAILEPTRQSVLAGKKHDLVVPPLTLDDIQAAGQERLLTVELGRELATLVMLAAVGLVAGQSPQRWLAGFMIAFGVWDLAYYAFLRMLLGWPVSLANWDVLFLLPVPWVAPVIAPVLVSLSLIAAGAIVLWRNSRGRPLAFGWFGCIALVAGGLTVIASMCWDYRNSLAGGWPHPFNWPLFAAGEVLGPIGFAVALRGRERRIV